MNEQPKPMTYLDHINAFDDRLAAGQFKDITSTDIAFYKALCSVCNKAAYKHFRSFRTDFEFPASSKDLCNRSHVSINTLKTCRNHLKAAGLIDFTKGGGRAVATVYVIKRIEKFVTDKRRSRATILSQNCDSIDTQILSQNCDSINGILSQNCDSKDGNTVTKLLAYIEDKDNVCREDTDTHILLSNEIPDTVKPAINEWFKHLKRIRPLTLEQVKLQLESIAAAIRKYGAEPTIRMIEYGTLKGYDSVKFDTLAKDFTKQDRITVSDNLVL